jgi:hypothetical protein
MTATTSNRWDVVTEVLRRLLASGSLSGVQIVSAEPTHDVERSAIWIGDIAGTVEPVNMRGLGRQPRDDNFSFDLLISAVVPGDEYGESAAVECERLYAAVEDVLADEPDLAGNVEGCKWVVTSGSNEGPNRRPLETGGGAFRKVQVRTYSRLS